MFKSFVVFLGKIVVSGLAFVVGILLGGMLTGVFGLEAPTLPAEMDGNTAMIAMLAGSPLLVLALLFVGRELAGGWLVRSLVLALLTWIAYLLNNVIEAVIFSSFVTSPWFNLVTFTPALLLCAGVTTWLFPSQQRNFSFIANWQAHFEQRPFRDWLWRLVVAALIFMPIYYLFGLMVVPFVGEYYRQGAFGFVQPTLAVLLPVLFVRSVLFLIACLPVVIAWRGRSLMLWLSLGLILFLCVGLLNLLGANWIPVWVRAIHLSEILADSFVYAGALLWLLRAASQPQERSKVPDRLKSAVRPI